AVDDHLDAGPGGVEYRAGPADEAVAQAPRHRGDERPPVAVRRAEQVRDRRADRLARRRAPDVRALLPRGPQHAATLPHPFQPTHEPADNANREYEIVIAV